MKFRIQIRDIRAVWLSGLILGFTGTASADVIRQTVSYPPDALAGWASIDFDGDGVPELSFEIEALGDESGGVMLLNVHSSLTTEVLLQDWGVLPLQAGDTVSLTPVTGQWEASGLRSTVWFKSFSYSQEQPPPPGQGVGMPGCGDFMGARFLSGTDWHYGWVRFGPLDTSPAPDPGWPSVLEYAYETFPNAPILVPEPSTRALILSGCALFCFYARQKGMVTRSAVMFTSQFKHRWRNSRRHAARHAV